MRDIRWHKDMEQSELLRGRPFLTPQRAGI
jgi:hypothetical protein